MSSESETGLEHYEGTYRVIGPPGTGKTRFLRNQVRKFAEHAAVFKRSPDILLCSLTKTAAKEIIRNRKGEPALPVEKWRVGTLHAHAFRSLSSPKIAESKEEVAAWNKAHPHFAIGGEVLGDPEDAEVEQASGAGPGDPLRNAFNLARARLVPFANLPPAVRAFADAWNQFKRGRATMDFSDMIEACIEDIPRAPGDPKIIVIDEAQDLSALEYKLAMKWGRAARATLVVGDHEQTIYAWRGADPRILFDDSVEEAKTRVLGQSWRVPRKVHLVATRWVRQLSVARHFEYRPRDEEGSVASLSASWRNVPVLVREVEKTVETESAMVLASCSYMLAPLVAELRRKGIAFSNPWRPSRGDWNPIRESSTGGGGQAAINSLLAPSRELRLWTLRELWAFGSILQADECFVRGGKKILESLIEERGEEEVDLDALSSVMLPEAIEALGNLARDMHEGVGLRSAIDWLTSRAMGSKARSLVYPRALAERYGGVPEERPRLYVGTIHSFKGGEADSVFVVPDISPNGARQWTAGGEQRDGLVRMFYVALTRARRRVVVLQPAGPAVNLISGGMR